MADESNEIEGAESPQGEAPKDAKAAEKQAAERMGVKFAEEDRFELWAWISIGLGVATVVAFIVAFLKLGTASIWAYQEMLFFCGIGTVLMTFWGLIRTFFNPPVLRRSRTIAFVTLLTVGYMTLSNPFDPPLSTDGWSTDITVRPPFEGEWMTLAGGQSRDTNFYARYPAMRWALAWAPVKDDKTFVKDGSRVEDYFCWGKDVLAPVPGEVVSYEGGMADVGMEEAPTGTLLGNHVGIKFEDGAYLFVSNLQEKSVTVRPGDVVKRGQVLGKCGRSGYTPEPLIVMHAQNTLNFPISEGLPLRVTYQVGDKTETSVPRGTSDWRGQLDGKVISPVTSE